jgi:hypothetical protein
MWERGWWAERDSAWPPPDAVSSQHPAAAVWFDNPQTRRGVVRVLVPMFKRRGKFLCLRLPMLSRRFVFDFSQLAHPCIDPHCEINHLY